MIASCAGLSEVRRVSPFQPLVPRVNFCVSSFHYKQISSPPSGVFVGLHCAPCHLPFEVQPFATIFFFFAGKIPTIIPRLPGDLDYFNVGLAVKPRGFPGDLPSLLAKFLSLAGVAAVLSIAGCLGESGAFEPMFDSLLKPESLVGIPAAGLRLSLKITYY